MTAAELKRAIKGLPTTSAKIRALAARGLSRADIARALGIRYQHVRNVLVQDEARAVAADRPGFSDAKQARLSDRRVMKVRLGPDGRVVIPAAFREALGFHEGDRLTVRLEDNELRVYSFEEGLRRAQAIVQSFVPEGVSLVDELIEERRREAAKEIEDE